MECPSLEEFYCYPGSDSRLNQTTALSPTEFCLGKVYVFIQRYRVELVTPTRFKTFGRRRRRGAVACLDITRIPTVLHR